MSRTECAHLKNIFKSNKFNNSSLYEKQQTIEAIKNMPNCGVTYRHINNELFSAVLSIYDEPMLTLAEKHRRIKNIVALNLLDEEQLDDIEALAQKRDDYDLFF